LKSKPALLALLLVLPAASALLFLRRPPPVPPPVVLHPTARQAAQAQRHIEGLQRELQQDAAPPEEAPQGRSKKGGSKKAWLAPPRPRTLRLSEEDLNVYLASNRTARKMLAARGVRAVQLVLSEPANLSIHAAVTVNGRAQNVQFDGALAPDSKLGLRYTATHAQVGRFSLPPAAVTAQANALAARLARQMHGRLPLAVQSIQVQGKTLVIMGIPVSRAKGTPRAPASPPPVSPARR